MCVEVLIVERFNKFYTIGKRFIIARLEFIQGNKVFHFIDIGIIVVAIAECSPQLLQGNADRFSEAAALDSRQGYDARPADGYDQRTYKKLQTKLS